MRMRSPRLYEHIRRHEILTLPGRTCLQKRMQNCRGGFGFNPSTFEAIKEKTKDMDEFSHRGGILIDGMKISEHLDVKSTGKKLCTILPVAFFKESIRNLTHMFLCMPISVLAN